MMKLKNNISKNLFWLISLFIIFSSCDDILDKQPLDKLRDNAFWKNESDAKLALAGCYHINNEKFAEKDWWSYRGLVVLEFATDNAFDRRGNNTNQSKLINGTNVNTNGMVYNYWESSYSKVSKCNNFLKNIERITEIDKETKKEMIAEVRFIRACQYFYTYNYWGDAPLVTKILTEQEANTIKRTSRSEIIKFVKEELLQASKDLPTKRKEENAGRATKSAALTFLGRVELREENFAKAAEIFKQIIDLNVHKIDDNYEHLFWVSGEKSSEIIFANQVLENSLGHAISQHFFPRIAGGWHFMCPLNDIVEQYLCTDGKTTKNSPLFNPDKPFENRDPRLAFSILLPSFSKFKNILYVSHPDSGAPDRIPVKAKTGYGLRKFCDESYTGNLLASGNNLPIIRYPEVLLSYLEAVIKDSKTVISQNLLDITINKVRLRKSVNMPIVTELNKEALLPIVMRERRVEFAFEGLRYWDLLRLRIAHKVLNRKIYGSKTGKGKNGNLIVNSEGHYYVAERKFRENTDYLWPIPQKELDINPELGQNKNYE